MGVNLVDVAREANVSISAASFALNGKAGVSESTRKRVIDVAKRLNYRPSLAGQQLRRSGPTAVGLYMPDIAFSYSYFMEITAGIAQELHLRGITLVLLPNASFGIGQDSISHVDGFIVLEPHADDKGVEAILAQHLPVVSADWPARDFGQPWAIVETSEQERLVEVLDRFSSQGSHRPGLILTDRVANISLEYEKTYLAWCVEHNIEPRIELMFVGQSESDRSTRFEKFFDAKSGCDAVFAAGDGIAILVAGIINLLGLAVGEDVLLVSEVDSPLMLAHTPPITSIDLQLKKIGQQCASLLLELSGTEKPAEPIVLKNQTVLVVRASG